jgi:hypothetical protein
MWYQSDSYSSSSASDTGSSLSCSWNILSITKSISISCSFLGMLEAMIVRIKSVFISYYSITGSPYMLSKEQSAYLWATSWCSLISSLYGLYHCRWLPFYHIVYSALRWITGETSYHIRRDDIDIATVLVSVSTQIYWSKHMENYIPYLRITIIGLSFYPIARILSYNGLLWPSVIVHSMLHITGNVANVVLYSAG